MPRKPLRPCCRVGCTELVDRGYCDKHKLEIKLYDKYRSNSNERGYDSKWRKFRESYLKAYPVCFDHLTIGYIEPSVDVHHIVKLVDSGKRLDPTNCMPLCHSCHSIRTKRGE